MSAPTLRLERSLLRRGVGLLAAMDEVGRGALAGPATVGVVMISAEVAAAPEGVRDSKLLSPAVRESLVPKIQEWAVGYAVGHARPGEVDAVGIVAALRLAGQRALATLPAPDLVLLDGSHDWLTDPQSLGLFAADQPQVPVRTQVKADLTCAAVAAASVLAKVERDGQMMSLAEEFPDYGWSNNKGYASAQHLRALAELGPSCHHRVSWRLPQSK